MSISDIPNNIATSGDLPKLCIIWISLLAIAVIEYMLESFYFSLLPRWNIYIFFVIASLLFFIVWSLGIISESK
jgi:membrane protein YdbS with pleckstrin-like domain